MWGNLADRLGATDINATLEKIGNAVAPREDSDDDEYHDGEGGSDCDYDDDDYDEDEDENYGFDGEGIINKVAGASPFRLAGILTRALDDRHPEIGNVEESGNSSCSVDKNTITNKDLFPRESIRRDEEIVRNDDNNAGNDCHVEDTKQTGDILQRTDKNLRVPSHRPRANLRQSSEVDKIIPTGLDVSNGDQSTDDISGVKDVPTEFQRSEEKIKRTLFDTMTLEAEMKAKIDVSILRNDATKASSIKTDRVSVINKSSKRSNKTHTDRNKSSSQQPLGLKQIPKSISTNLIEVDTPIVARNKAKKEEKEHKKVVLQNEERKVVAELPLAGTTNVTGNVSAEEGKLQRKIVEKKIDVSVNTNIKAKTSTPILIESTEMQAVSPFSDTNKFEEKSRLSSKSTLQRDGDVGTANIIKTSSSKSNEKIDKMPSSTAHDGSSKKPPRTMKDTEQQLLEADSSCKELQTQLVVAKQEIEAIRNQAHWDKEKAQSEREDLIVQFHSKEARLLQATSEENQNETLLLQKDYSTKIQNLEHLLVKERKKSQEQQTEFKRLLQESYSNVDRMETQLRTTVNKYEKEIAQVQQQEERAIRKVDDRMAQTMAVLDERDEEIKSLKKCMKNMESKVNEHQEGEEEAEEELEEVHQENDSLRQTIEKLELEKKNLKDQVATLKTGSEELSGLQMELTMLKEERDRERTKNQTVMDSAMSSRTQLEIERDNALSKLRDSKQQLAATLGDLEISRADYSRIIMANDNLQSALEAFQDERRAEMEMIDEQSRESEEAIKSAHATATSALKQIHDTETYKIQKASDNAVKNVMHEMELVEGNLEKSKSENNQLRRSLDEAIHRLQTTQEDVIDRNVMKNILLDWCTLNDKSKRHQVLQVMANLLHFSEDEKEKVHLTSKSLDSVRAKVVGALTAPLPPSKADVEHLEGSNVHEKWVNFLMAETDEV